MKGLSSEVEKSNPDAARSCLEGLEETFPVPSRASSSPHFRSE